MNVILFDGVCNLCNGFVNFIIDHDKGNEFKFASLQSDFGKKLIGDKFSDMSTVVYYDGNKFYEKSEAVLEIAKKLPIIRWVAFFSIIPKFIRDALYMLISRNRYFIFGKEDACRVPTPELKERFLE
ncbi:thiol-disulfide oxidoreductase DCC family protein [Arcticibacterium luteifluviistationis]|uniref:Thiol-disulfide oxidoreductase n=1 Tax=Arcticibacterium luteifluviistationis TaxID=1784714 RepID=A0A2Z4GFL5_9BACT|nr:DCC1-like thiol-disulfide oxidoreductase family protein [Arcticibacterium luteifluviistationis]AWW00180.1 thiol-disulfide oxidoreductase [Arcticibacterium luteifluviistationis]